MICSTCGKEMAEGLKFCANCGSPLVQAGGAHAAAAAVNEAAQAAASAGAAAAAGAPERSYGQAPGAQQSYSQQPYGQPAQNGAQQQYWGQQPGQPYQQPGYQQPVQQIWPEQPPTSRALAMAVYLGGLITLIVALCVRDKNDPFITHHLNQALVIFIGSIIAGVTAFIIIGGILGIYLLVMSIMGAVRAYNSSMEELPLIGQIHLLK